jgi:hypothetical protein
MPHAAALFHARLRRQPLPIHGTLAEIWIDGEISNRECSEVLKKNGCPVKASREGRGSPLNDHARAGDFVPRHGNAEPRFIRAPAAHTNQKAGAILAGELRVEVSNQSRHFLAVPAFKAVRIVFGFARKNQRPNLQNAEFRDLCRFARTRFRAECTGSRRAQAPLPQQWRCALWRTVKWPTWLVRASAITLSLKRSGRMITAAH